MRVHCTRQTIPVFTSVTATRYCVPLQPSWVPLRPRGQTFRSAVLPNGKQEARRAASSLPSDGTEAQTKLIPQPSVPLVPSRGILWCPQWKNRPPPPSRAALYHRGLGWSPLLTFAVRHLSDKEANSRFLCSSPLRVFIIFVPPTDKDVLI